MGILLQEVQKFFGWLVNNYVILFGMKEYILVECQGGFVFEEVVDRVLGVCWVCDSLDLMEWDGGELIDLEKLIVFGKFGICVCWYCFVYMDFIGICKCDV